MKKCLIVIDMQKDFVDGSLANPAAQAIVPLIKERLETVKAENESIIFTYDTHYTETSGNNVKYEDSLEGKLLPIPHCFDGSDGWKITEELRPYADKAAYVKKNTFGYINWEGYFNDMFDENTFPDDFPEEIELCGTVSSICVLANAVILRATYPNIKITVNSNLCADLSPEMHNAAMSVLKAQQVNVI